MAPVQKITQQKILLAEDNPVNMYFLETVVKIEFPSLTIIKAINGTETLTLFRENRPDLLILDLSLPEISGYGIIEQLQVDNLFDSKRIIIMTANESQDVRESMIRFGLTNYLCKPANKDIIVMLIKNCLGV